MEETRNTQFYVTEQTEISEQNNYIFQENYSENNVKELSGGSPCLIQQKGIYRNTWERGPTGKCPTLCRSLAGGSPLSVGYGCLSDNIKI